MTSPEITILTHLRWLAIYILIEYNALFINLVLNSVAVVIYWFSHAFIRGERLWIPIRERRCSNMLIEISERNSRFRLEHDVSCADFVWFRAQLGFPPIWFCSHKRQMAAHMYQVRMDDLITNSSNRLNIRMPNAIIVKLSDVNHFSPFPENWIRWRCSGTLGQTALQIDTQMDFRCATLWPINYVWWHLRERFTLVACCH